MKAKKKLNQLKKRIGIDEYKNGELDVTGKYESVKSRLENLEKLQQGIIEESIIFQTNYDFETGTKENLEVSENRLKGSGHWVKEIDLGENSLEFGRIEWETFKEEYLETEVSSTINSSGAIVEIDTGSGYRIVDREQTPTNPFNHRFKIKVTMDGTVELDKLKINFKIRTIRDQISDIEKNISINLNKHNLRVNSILNQSAYKFTDMVFDDFHNDTGIDKEKSTGYLFDANKKVIMVDQSKEKAEIVLKPEETLNPTKCFVSIAVNEQTTKEIIIPFENGQFEGISIKHGTIKLNKENENEYIVFGFFETDIIDLGENIKRIKGVFSDNDTPSNSRINILFKTSKNKIDFTEYKSIADINGLDIDDRFIQIRLEIYAAVSAQSRTAIDSYQFNGDVQVDGDRISIKSSDKMLKRINDISNDSKDLSIPFFYNILKRNNNIATAFDYEANQAIEELGYLSIRGQYI